MADFIEIWSLRNRLILDGYYDPKKFVEIDALQMERQIRKLANEKYGWNSPEPSQYKLKEYEIDYIGRMTPEERVSYVKNFLTDWDGSRTIRGVGGLVDKAISVLRYNRYANPQTLENAKRFWDNTTIDEFLKSETLIDNLKNAREGGFSYENYFLIKDLQTVKAWGKKNNYSIDVIIFHIPYKLVELRIGDLRHDTIQK